MQILSKADLAKRLGCSESLVTSYEKDGFFIGLRPHGRGGKVFYILDEVIAGFLRKRDSWKFGREI